MGKWKVLQALYCFAGVGFAAHDLLAKVDMVTAMWHAFVWPWAQWMLIRDTAMHAIAPVMKLIT